MVSGGSKKGLMTQASVGGLCSRQTDWTELNIDSRPSPVRIKCKVGVPRRVDSRAPHELMAVVKRSRNPFHRKTAGSFAAFAVLANKTAPLRNVVMSSTNARGAALPLR